MFSISWKRECIILSRTSEDSEVKNRQFDRFFSEYHANFKHSQEWSMAHRPKVFLSVFFYQSDFPDLITCFRKHRKHSANTIPNKIFECWSCGTALLQLSAWRQEAPIRCLKSKFLKFADLRPLSESRMHHFEPNKRRL